MPQIELDEKRKQQLITKCNTVSLSIILSYIQSGDITLDDLPTLNAERKKYIEEQLSRMPNPQEQKEWMSIESQKANPSQQLLDMIVAYVRNWEGSRPSGNHVDEANSLYDIIENSLKESARQLEEDDWNSVDPFSQSSLMAYLAKYPNSVHKKEIEDSIWGLVNKEDVSELQNYTNYFPNSENTNIAKKLLGAIYDWSNVKASNDLRTINNYIKENPESPFKQQAQILLLGLKQSEIGMMKSNANVYEKERLISYLDDGIFSKQELISAGVMTESVLDTLLNTDVKADLPDINQAIAGSVAICKDGFTDVFFFGIPSTGKTCVLMGLSRSDSLEINLASGGGDYASALQQYTDVGITVPRTPGTFVTTLEATITSENETNCDHPVNLVEMSGEEFAVGIANNPDHVFTFEEMGSGATELLKNSNRKVFFLIIDPTANVVRFSREIIDSYDEETGKPIKHLEYCVVNQRTIIQKMVNIFQDPANADIMKKVDSIHIIMTKSDTLGNPVEREEKAYQIFNDKFGSGILNPLIKLCKEYNINASTDFHPKLFTFSLGTFYVGGIYEYEPTDSNRLVKAIWNSTVGKKRKAWWDRFKEKVN